jgi:VIT1/CCC1 family predicted Fe2+/Mn2+ transporter/demethoxyubiquinone hydroxylase (CLK1/Coq7/Cat5 family)
MDSTSAPTKQPTPADIKRYRANYQGEIDGVELYRLLANAEKNPDRAKIFLDLAETEKRHVQVWATRLREAGVDPGAPRPTLRVRALGFLARRLGTRAVLPMVSAMESSGFDNYMAQSEAGPPMARDERSHARTLATLSGQRGAEPATAITRDERWHRVDSGGAFRAAIFGVNDGLVSNMSLVIGVAGANPDGRFIILAGVSGLLAGAFSMGAGEFVSVMSQRELFERQIALEKEELEADPESERQELALIYRAKGLSQQEAEALSARIISDRGVALETLAREELGLNPDELGAPYRVSVSSFIAFAAGAVIPVIPFLFGSEWLNFGLSLALSGIALFAVGAGVSLFTGRGMLFSGGRQLAIGAIAAAVTFTIGKMIGVNAG